MANETITSNSYAACFSFRIDSGLLNGFVTLKGDRYVSVAGKGYKILGTIQTLPTTFPGNAGILTHYNHQMNVPLASNVSYGDYAKISTPGTEGEQRFEKWVDTDSESLKVGIFVTSGTTGGTADLLY